jgi:hypothetical protein
MTRTKYLVAKLRPGKGFAHFFHLGFVAVVPIVVFILVRLQFENVALIIILLSKWRMFAVRARHWLAHIRTNAVDIIVGLSILACMSQSHAASVQLLWLVVYELWLLIIKPGSRPLLVSAQAMIGQFLGLTALFLAFPSGSLALYVLLVWAITYFSARHFFGSFDEPNAQILASFWGFFGAGLMWILGHWLLFIGSVAQVAILLSVIGYGLAGLYYLDETDKLSRVVRRQILLVMFAMVLIIIVFSDWGDKAV